MKIIEQFIATESTPLTTKIITRFDKLSHNLPEGLVGLFRICKNTEDLTDYTKSELYYDDCMLQDYLHNEITPDPDDHVLANLLKDCIMLEYIQMTEDEYKDSMDYDGPLTLQIEEKPTPHPLANLREENRLLLATLMYTTCQLTHAQYPDHFTAPPTHITLEYCKGLIDNCQNKDHLFEIIEEFIGTNPILDLCYDLISIH